MALEKLRECLRGLTDETSMASVASDAGLDRITVSRLVRHEGRDPKVSTIISIMRAYPDRALDMTLAMVADDEEQDEC